MTIVCRRTALLLWIPKRNSEWNAVDWRTGRARPAGVAAAGRDTRAAAVAAGRDTRAIFSFLLFRRTVHRPSPCSGQSVSRLLCCLPEDGCGFFIVCTDHVNRSENNGQEARACLDFRGGPVHEPWGSSHHPESNDLGTPAPAFPLAIPRLSAPARPPA